MIDPFFGTVIAGALVAIPATMAWRGTNKNASQESVDKVDKRVTELHNCLDEHTAQDAQNFLLIDQRFDEAARDRERKA